MKASHYPKLKSLRTILEQHEILRDNLQHLKLELADIIGELRRHKIGTIEYSSGEILAINQEEKRISERIEILEFQIKTLNQTEGSQEIIINQIRLLEKFINA